VEGALIKLRYYPMVWENRAKQENTAVIIDILTAIRAEHLPNTKMELLNGGSKTRQYAANSERSNSMVFLPPRSEYVSAECRNVIQLGK
jgi:hypothetical protein